MPRQPRVLQTTYSGLSPSLQDAPLLAILVALVLDPAFVGRATRLRRVDVQKMPCRTTAPYFDRVPRHEAFILRRRIETCIRFGQLVPPYPLRRIGKNWYETRESLLNARLTVSGPSAAEARIVAIRLSRSNLVIRPALTGAAVHRPISAIRNVRISEARFDLPGPVI